MSRKTADALGRVLGLPLTPIDNPARIEKAGMKIAEREVEHEASMSEDAASVKEQNGGTEAVR